MDSDLPGEFGPLEPGLDQLFQTLTSGPTAGELAGEQAALAMFRENLWPADGATKVLGDSPDPDTGPRKPASGPGRAGRQGRSGLLGRSGRAPGRWGLRLAAAATLALAGGMTAAAYAAVLPTPIQHFANEAFGVFGVPGPGSRAHPNPSRRISRHTAPASGLPSTSPGQVTPTAPQPSSSRRHSASASPSASPSPSRSAGGPTVLSATVASSEIAAGTQAVIDGQLTRSGKGVAGTTVRLLERIGRRPTWQAAGTETTNSQGNVAVTIPALTVNTAFQWIGPGGATSPVVTITVIPPIQATLELGPGGVRDLLVVTTQYAHRGNVVVLEVQSASGNWVRLRWRLLNAAGMTRFVIKARVLGNKDLQVVLRATARHGASVSNTVTVPPPS